MKFTKCILGVAMVVFAAAAAAPAQADNSQVASRMAAIRSLALRCAVQPVHIQPDGVPLNRPTRSVCSDLEIHGTTAVFHFAAGTLQILVRDSAHSDGGDLVTVMLVDERGRHGIVADDVLAFRDPILAVLGQDGSKLAKVRE